MPVHHLFPTNDARHPRAGLVDALQQWRDPAWAATSECHVPEQRAIDANRATIERAKGALMRRYGIDTFQAFALMVRWARQTHTPVHTLARTLVQRHRPGAQMTSSVAGRNETQFAPDATSPARARRFVQRYLNQQDLPYLVDASCLVVSELVTNAVVHARTPIRVSIEEMQFCVKLTVYDESVDLPVLSLADGVGTDNEGGRGLGIVDAYSEDWGIDLAGDEGKCIWALFAVRSKSSGVEGRTPGPTLRDLAPHVDPVC